MDKKKYNYGVEILRVFLAFMVVIDHFYKNKKKYTYTLYYHIPTFFIISFYFTYNTLVSFINSLYWMVNYSMGFKKYILLFISFKL